MINLTQKVCSYKDNCEIDCPIETTEIDESTIDYELLTDLSDRLIKLIKYMFSKQDVYTFKNIKDVITDYYGNKFSNGNIIYLTLDKMIKNKTGFFNSKRYKRLFDF